ncbi:SDR family NAD(P)-dependent oxidoreductase [Natronosporangium hydrolyticum]|uniref:SDR family NAD(P)-dependent oxidoreductase n=1 Tax=Natronosporangium hydrolyticum TaxID=2811111 RepID=A0A895Y5F7_9ACTN|nr:oxidoreductase [Natronosporangium hydrolyticum]QSB12641.1 SDR family NAD(P)-dependent oxidoreductase [Natronosporangium hydrolyticum]
MTVAGETGEARHTDPIPELHGRTYLVTGGNSGLGYHTIRVLLGHGARVVMAVRDLDRGYAAAQALRAGQPTAELEVRVLDLADLDSVRHCAAALRADRVPVDVLINNAGVMMTPLRRSAQGHELQLAVNHLGHFALTGLLLDTLRDGPGARVVTVTSEMHRLGRLDPDDLGDTGYRPDRAYGRAKLANALFGLELDRRLRAAAVPVRSLLAHPGYAATNLQLSGPTGLLRSGFQLANRIIAQDAAGGARSQLYAATSPDAKGGEYIGPSAMLRGAPKVLAPSAAARDPELARRLWRRSEELTGVRFGLPE